MGARAYPITIPSPGKFPKTAAEAIAYLDVRNGKRYKRTATATFCNIYAYDYCTLRGVFLPRIWWTVEALVKMQSGEAVPMIYGKTVYELNANGLFDWLHRWGATFGWEHTKDFNELQHNVNLGAVGLLVAARVEPMKPGHITIVVPEDAKHMAGRVGGATLAPLQCQAGASNWEYKTGANWWASPLYRAWGAWYNIPEAVPEP